MPRPRKAQKIRQRDGKIVRESKMGFPRLLRKGRGTVFTRRESVSLNKLKITRK